MDKKQVLDILERRAFPGSGKGATLVETHISWVILTPDFAFKIKKPVRYDFLDYSTLLARKKFCLAGPVKVLSEGGFPEKFPGVYKLSLIHI